MKIETFVTGIISTNCYVVHNEDTKEAVIIDPAYYPKKMKAYIAEEGLEIRAILLTHGHFDHIMGIDAILEEFPVPVFVHEDEEELINDIVLNESKTYTNGYTFSKAEYIRDGQILKFAGYEFKVIHTPGHTSGGVCYYVESEQTLFSGDTLFYASVGRSDFPTSSTSALIRSIREKLLVLPDETVVYPGHMGATSIANEKKMNPYI